MPTNENDYRKRYEALPHGDINQHGDADDLLIDMLAEIESRANRLALFEEIYSDLARMGFGTDESVDGSDAVEYLGKLFIDMQEAFQRDNVPVPAIASEEEDGGPYHWPRCVDCPVHGSKEVGELQHDAEKAHNKDLDAAWSCPECGADSEIDDIPF